MSHLEADVISLTAAVSACASAMHWEVVMDLLAEHDGNEATYQAAVPWCPDIMCSFFGWFDHNSLGHQTNNHRVVVIDSEGCGHSKVAACQRAAQWEHAAFLLSHFRSTLRTALGSKRKLPEMLRALNMTLVLGFRGFSKSYPRGVLNYPFWGDQTLQLHSRLEGFPLQLCTV